MTVTEIHTVMGEEAWGTEEAGSEGVRVWQLNHPGIREGFLEEVTLNPDIER